MEQLGYSDSFKDLIRVGKKVESVTRLEVIPPREICMSCRPLTGDAQPHIDFAAYSHFLNAAGTIVIFDNARVYPNTGIIQMKEGHIVAEFIDGLYGKQWQLGSRAWDNRDKMKKKMNLKKMMVTALIEPSDYYTWMGNMISKFYLLMKSGHWKEIDCFLVADISQNYQLETFNAFGITDKILTVKNLKNIDVINATKTVFIPTNVLLGKWGCDALRKCFTLFRLPIARQREWQDYKRIYLSRDDAKYRQVINEDEVVSFLDKYGFKKVVLSTLDVATQVHLFRNAEVVAGPHGSAFTNITSCRKGAKIVEFFSTEYAHSTYWEMSNYLGLRHGYVSDDGSSRIIENENWGSEKDMTVNLNRLEKIFKMMHIEKRKERFTK